jgi:glycosyltransferase involved in cell wall biosynthesis
MKTTDKDNIVSKIAAVSMVRDECDILELFVRINSKWADRFFILDNGSTDNTPHILRRLAEEGFPITVYTDTGINFDQSRATTQIVRKAISSSAFDYVFPIDCDEFISNADAFRTSLAHSSSLDSASFVEWSTLIPKSSDSMLEAAPLYTGFERRQTETRRIRKIILTKKVAQSSIVQAGNHGAVSSDGTEIKGTNLKVDFFHIPVRSKAQIIAKAIIGSYKMSIKSGRGKHEAFHWDEMVKMMRQYRFDLSDEQLRDLAFNYGNSSNDPKFRSSIPVSVGSNSDYFRYPDLARINLAARLDGFLGQLSRELVLNRSNLGLFKKAMRRLID